MKVNIKVYPIPTDKIGMVTTKVDNIMRFAIAQDSEGKVVEYNPLSPSCTSLQVVKSNGLERRIPGYVMKMYSRSGNSDLWLGIDFSVRVPYIAMYQPSLCDLIRKIAYAEVRTGRRVELEVKVVDTPELQYALEREDIREHRIPWPQSAQYDGLPVLLTMGNADVVFYRMTALAIQQAAVILKLPGIRIEDRPLLNDVFSLVWPVTPLAQFLNGMGFVV